MIAYLGQFGAEFPIFNVFRYITFRTGGATITALIIWAFFVDSHFEKAYKPNIIYFQQWTLDRTDEQIIAQQKIDEAKRQIEDRVRLLFCSS